MTNYKELVKELRKRGLTNGASAGHHSGIFDQAADAIEELSKSQWISVEGRLTKPDGTYCRDACGQEGTCSWLERGDPCTDAELYARLKAYEDTGLEPERLLKIIQAEQEGRLIVLPCKVGDKVYRIDHDAETNIRVDLCVGAKISLSGELLIGLSGDRWWSSDRFGKTIFLTREEAEAALRKEETA